MMNGGAGYAITTVVGTEPHGGLRALRHPPRAVIVTERTDACLSP